MKEQAGILLGESNQEVKNALDYFKVANKKALKSVATNGEPFRGINKYGIVDLVGLLNQAAAMPETGRDLNSVMEELNNILVDAVLAHAGAEELEQVSAKEWKKGFDALIRLFCKDYSEEELHYDQDAIGADGVLKVIDIAFDVKDGVTTSFEKSVSDYLSKQGKLMNEMGFDGSLKNSYLLVGFSNYVMDEVHTCAFRAYFTNFDAESIKITHSCDDDELKFKFKFDVMHYNANFMLSSWMSDSNFRDKVNHFIDSYNPDFSYFGNETNDKAFVTAQKFRV